MSKRDWSQFKTSGGICGDGGFYSEWLKSGLLRLFALEKVLGNFYGFVSTFKPVKCVLQVDGKTLGCYSYLSLIKHSYNYCSCSSLK